MSHSAGRMNRSAIAVGGQNLGVGSLPRKPKRKGFHVKMNQNGNGKKQKVGEVNDVVVDGGVELVDQFSELPEHIVHRILALLRCPKDVARISVLSKKWKSMWASFHSFDFDERKFQAQGSTRTRGRFQDVQRKKFRRYVSKSMATRLEPMSCVQKFRLHVTSFNKVFAPTMNDWIHAAINKHVKELEIRVQVVKDTRYNFPWMVLAAKSLTSLKLYGCGFCGLPAIELPNIRELSIKKAHINECIIQNFFHGCPSIEDFRLVHCRGLESLRVSNLMKLHRTEIHLCCGLTKVEIEAKNLQMFCFQGYEHIKCNINLVSCDSLRDLTLRDTKMSDKWFQEQISKSPALEKLVLLECYKLERITILSAKLKKLALIRCKKLLEANIDAPNLLSFEYSGCQMCFSSMNISSLAEVKINFESRQSKLSTELHKYLESIDESKGFKSVVCTRQKDVTIYEELRGIKLPTVPNFKIELTESLLNLRDVVGGRLRDCHPRSLSVVSSSSSECLQLINKMMMTREESTNCCQYYSKKCWRHYLKDVEIVESHNQITTFRLKWRDQHSDMSWEESEDLSV